MAHITVIGENRLVDNQNIGMVYLVDIWISEEILNKAILLGFDVEKHETENKSSKIIII